MVRNPFPLPAPDELVRTSLEQVRHICPPTGRVPEIALLIACARRRLSSDQVALVKALTEQPLDWEFVLYSADCNGVLPLLFRHLRETSASTPEVVWRSLKDTSEQTLRRNLWISSRLVRLLKLLKENGIHGIPFKGPVLAHLLYGNLALRRCADLDILVPAAAVLRTKDVLLNAGLQSWTRLPAHLERDFVLYGSEWAYADGDLLVEIQWLLSPSYFCWPIELEAETRPLAFAGTTVPVLTPEALLWMLCLHGGKHLWNRLIWLADLHELLQSYPQLKWADVRTRTTETGTHRFLLLGLNLASTLLGTELPEDIKSDIARDDVVQRFTDLIGCRLDEPRDPTELQFHVNMLRLRQRARDRVRYVTGLALNPTLVEWSLIRFPRSLKSLYRIVRMARVLGRLACALFGRATVVQ
jgi:hypothetical protein